jgi:hypothetical protein
MGNKNMLHTTASLVLPSADVQELTREWTELAERYPWYAMPWIMLAKGQGEADQLEKAALFVPNTLWLHWLLNQAPDAPEPATVAVAASAMSQPTLATTAFESEEDGLQQTETKAGDLPAQEAMPDDAEAAPQIPITVGEPEVTQHTEADALEIATSEPDPMTDLDAPPGLSAGALVITDQEDFPPAAEPAVSHTPAQQDLAAEDPLPAEMDADHSHVATAYPDELQVATSPIPDSHDASPLLPETLTPEQLQEETGGVFAALLSAEEDFPVEDTTHQHGDSLPVAATEAALSMVPETQMPEQLHEETGGVFAALLSAEEDFRVEAAAEHQKDTLSIAATDSALAIVPETPTPEQHQEETEVVSAPLLSAEENVPDEETTGQRDERLPIAATEAALTSVPETPKLEQHILNREVVPTALLSSETDAEVDDSTQARQSDLPTADPAAKESKGQDSKITDGSVVHELPTVFLQDNATADPETDDEATANDTNPLTITYTSASQDGNLFTPFHLIDYFASQGIKLNTVGLPKTSFDKKVMSFTQWLKTMKKVNFERHAGQIVADPAVEASAKASLTKEDVVTEAMAQVLEQQGKHAQATQLYLKLILLHPEKSAFFAARIHDLNK